MKKTITLSFAAIFTAYGINAQNIFPSTGAAGIGTTTPDASSLLEIKSITKGLLIPRMSKNQRDAIAAPATGLMIYQTNSIPGFYYYDGAVWASVASNAWNIKGNSGTVAGTNFIGTTDAQSLVFKVNNKKAGLLDFDVSKANSAFGYQSLNSNTGNSNSAFGYQSLFNNTTGTANMAIGVHALFSNNTGSYNAANGAEALYTNTTGYFNTANGFSALNKNTTGDRNTANGSFALTNNTSGTRNTATGVDAMFTNTTGSTNVANGFEALHNNKTGYSNVALGAEALYSNIENHNLVAIGDSALYNNGIDVNDINNEGNDNIAIGSKSLFSNTTGRDNIAIGPYALYLNISGNLNTAIGENTLVNSNGSFNTGIGASALVSNLNGNNNTAVGEAALPNNNSGNDNTAVGVQALRPNSSGVGNTGVGVDVLEYNELGNWNTAIGYHSGMSVYNLSNISALGNGAVATTANQVMLGNTSVMSVWAAGTYMIYSDARFKKNIKENVPGLEFIKQLTPVTYNYDIHKLNDYINPDINLKGQPKESNELQKLKEDAIVKKEHKLYTGFVAQDVEKVADKINYEFSGLHKPENDKDPYGLSYADFVVPLVKAVQELSAKNDSLSTKISEFERLATENEALKSRLNIIEQKLGIASQGNISTSVILSNANLGQNIPNPFNHTTTINYVLPQTYSSAKIIIIDKSGKVLKEINISGTGKGGLMIDASTLSSGAYQYSLYVNEKLIDSKQMVITK